MKKKSSTGKDTISPGIIVKMYEYFLAPLVNICNVPFLYDIFPTKSK